MGNGHDLCEMFMMDECIVTVLKFMDNVDMRMLIRIVQVLYLFNAEFSGVSIDCDFFISC